MEIQTAVALFELHNEARRRGVPEKGLKPLTKRMKTLIKKSIPHFFGIENIDEPSSASAIAATALASSPDKVDQKVSVTVDAALVVAATALASSPDKVDQKVSVKVDAALVVAPTTIASPLDIVDNRVSNKVNDASIVLTGKPTAENPPDLVQCPGQSVKGKKDLKVTYSRKLLEAMIIHFSWQEAGRAESIMFFRQNFKKFTDLDHVPVSDDLLLQQVFKSKKPYIESLRAYWKTFEVDLNLYIQPAYDYEQGDMYPTIQALP